MSRIATLRSWTIPNSADPAQLRRYKLEARAETLDDDKRKDLENLAKGLFDKHNTESPSLLHPGNTETDGPLNSGHPPTPPPPPLLSGPVPPPATTSSGPSWINHDLLAGMANVLKDIDRSPEGEALRDAAMRDLANSGAGPSGASSGFVDLFKGAINSEEAAWLAHNLKPPSMARIVGVLVKASPAVLQAVRRSATYGMLDGMIWVAVLMLIGAAVWMACAARGRQAAGRTRSK